MKKRKVVSILLAATMAGSMASVKTEDETNLAVWAVLGILSVGMILLFSGKKQRA